MRFLVGMILLVAASALRVRGETTTFFVRPADIDARYAAQQDSHFVALNPSVAANGKLLVFFPGTGAETRNYRLFPGVAADLGFHAVSIAYPNGAPTVAALCAQNADTNCYLHVRQEVCYGTDASPDIDVDTLNSIVTRLDKLLRYLDGHYPDAGWGQFLSGNGIAWGKIAVAGHSQGSGHALYLGHTQACERVIMFAGADDYSDRYHRAANWVSNSSVTPAKALFSFLHLRDDVWDYAKQYAVAQAAGMTASGDDSTSVDEAAPPYGGSHCLYTNVDPNFPNLYSSKHDGMVVDLMTPRDGLKPLYQPVWTYMLTAPVSGSSALGRSARGGKPAGGVPVLRFETGGGRAAGIRLMTVSGKEAEGKAFDVAGRELSAGLSLRLSSRNPAR